MGQKLKVCMLIDAWFPFVGGGQIHVQNLIKHLQTNHPIKVYLYHAPHHNIFIRALWCFWVIPQVFILSAVEGPFAIIHAHAFAAGVPGKILSLLLKIPVVYTVHGSHLMDAKSAGLKAKLERYLLTGIRYDQQISVTKAFLTYPNVNLHIAVISNGVDVNSFDQIKTPKHSQFTFLYVGRDHPTKGIDILRQAFAVAQKKYPHIQLKLITKFKPAQLIREYKRAHVFVLPSLVEGQPLVLLEAWAAQLPVIATKTSGVQELAQHGKNAYLVDPGSQIQLQQAITKLYTTSTSKRHQLGLAGYKLVKSHFNWDTVAHQTWAVYDQVYRRYFN